MVAVVVNDDDLFGQAVPVELVPVGAPALGGAGTAVGHVGGDWGQLLRLAVGLCCPAQVGIRGGVSVTVVERVAYASGAVCKGCIGERRLVGVMVGIVLVMGR